MVLLAQIDGNSTKTCRTVLAIAAAPIGPSFSPLGMNGSMPAPVTMKQRRQGRPRCGAPGPP